MSTHLQHLENMAYVFDEAFDDSDGEISDSYDLLDEFLQELKKAGLLGLCMQHGLYAAFRGQCPACNWCRDCECSPCECEGDEVCVECGETECECEELT